MIDKLQYLGRTFQEVCEAALEEFYEANGYYPTPEQAVKLTDEAREEIMERNLPPFLIKAIEQIKIAWEKYDAGETSDLDCDYCELQSSINAAEVEHIITSEQAWYLRKKYFQI